MHFKKGYEGVFVLVAIGFWWLMSQTFSVTDGRGLSLYFWQFGLLALVQTIILQGKITGFLPPPTHSPWKQTPFMIQKRPHHFIHKVMCFFSLRKCHHHCFCCSWSWILWHLSVVRSFSQLEPFSSASHGHKKTEHSFHFWLYIWTDLSGKIFVEMVAEKLQICFGVISAFPVKAAKCNKRRLQPVCTIWRL